jgi:predicted alpha/beta superfamily hydrolase/acetyl esterase/lipase
MMRRLGSVIVTIVIGLAGATRAGQAQIVRLWPGAAPGSESWDWQEHTYASTPIGRVIMDVVTPTLTAYLPPRAEATGTGVIVAPGGGFVALAMDHGGDDVARWLQQHGIAAFVLKYRVVRKLSQGMPVMDPDTAGRYGIADGIQAIKVVREHAEEWGIAPDRVGFIGFSAGAMVSAATALNPDSAARPDFAAMIYGGPFGKIPAIPAHLPPLFLAWAQDDDEVLPQIEAFYAALRAAGVSPEAHIYKSGGHGFGIERQGTTSDHWADEYYYWLESLHLTVPPQPMGQARALPGDSVPAHDSLTIQSAALGEPRPINIHLPEGYAGSARRYPVLYMPDGGIDEDFPHVVSTLDSLVTLGKVRPMIVVGIPNTERRRDLTGPTRLASDSAIAPHVGGSAAFRQFIGDELIPAIDARYRTTGERSIIGESLAGLFIVETFLRQPSLFDHYIAFDPSIWWNKANLADSAVALIARMDSVPGSIFLTSSGDDIDAGTARVASAIDAAHLAGLRARYIPRPDLTHATIFRAVAPQAMIEGLQPR